MASKCVLFIVLSIQFGVGAGTTAADQCKNSTTYIDGYLKYECRENLVTSRVFKTNLPVGCVNDAKADVKPGETWTTEEYKFLCIKQSEKTVTYLTIHCFTPSGAVLSVGRETEENHILYKCDKNDKNLVTLVEKPIKKCFWNKEPKKEGETWFAGQLHLMCIKGENDSVISKAIGCRTWEGLVLKPGAITKVDGKLVKCTVTGGKIWIEVAADKSDENSKEIKETTVSPAVTTPITPEAPKFTCQVGHPVTVGPNEDLVGCELDSAKNNSDPLVTQWSCGGDSYCQIFDENTSYCCTVPQLPPRIVPLLHANCDLHPDYLACVRDNFGPTLLAKLKKYYADAAWNPIHQLQNTTQLNSIISASDSQSDDSSDSEEKQAKFVQWVGRLCSQRGFFRACTADINIRECYVTEYMDTWLESFMEICNPDKFRGNLAAIACAAEAVETPEGCKCADLASAALAQVVDSQFTEYKRFCQQLGLAFRCLQKPMKEVCGKESQKHLRFLTKYTSRMVSVLLTDECVADIYQFWETKTTAPTSKSEEKTKLPESTVPVTVTSTSPKSTMSEIPTTLKVTTMTTMKLTDMPTSILIESTSVKTTDMPTEKVTGSSTEKVTDVWTDKVTETSTNKVTEMSSEKPSTTIMDTTKIESPKTELLTTVKVTGESSMATTTLTEMVETSTKMPVEITTSKHDTLETTKKLIDLPTKKTA